jgi:hypothetical protein
VSREENVKRVPKMPERVEINLTSDLITDESTK